MHPIDRAIQEMQARRQARQMWPRAQLVATAVRMTNN